MTRRRLRNIITFVRTAKALRSLLPRGSRRLFAFAGIADLFINNAKKGAHTAGCPERYATIGMKYSLAQLLEFVEESDIKFIRLAFCDSFGVQKNIAIMASQLAHAVENGVPFDASSIDGFANVTESDLYLVPDLGTFSLLPWRPSEGCVARLFCNIQYPDGRPFEGDGRYLLQQAEQRASAMGYRFLVGWKCEFYLFENDERGRPTLQPFDDAGYFDMVPMDRGENVRRDICLTLEEMGIQPQRSHHENGPGQNEVDFRCASPLRSADDLMAMRTVVKAISAQNGLFASFLPKPLRDKSGSGMHINLSLFKDEQDLFADFRTNPDPAAASFLAGILRRMPEITIFANPLPGSYKRLGHLEAPGTVGWSCQNRSSLVRIPAVKGDACNMELRSPDPSCNPYLVTALLLEAGFEGLEEKLPLQPAADQSVDALPLPDSLEKAVAVARESEFLRRVLPENLLNSYLECKAQEARNYAAERDPYRYELEKYFRCI